MKRQIVRDLASLAADRVQDAVGSVLQLTDTSEARMDIVVGALTTMLCIAGHEARDALKHKGYKKPGSAVICAAAVAIGILDTIEKREKRNARNH
jgi:hypothetical protein